MNPFFGLLIGLALLIGGGTLVVKSASTIAARYGVSPVIVGLTIVAFGTSAPELMVNLIGALRNETELAFGNVVGSNLANLGLVLGSAAMVRTIEIHGQIVRREVPLLLMATAVIVVMAADELLREAAAQIDRADALILLLLFGIFLYVTVHDVLRKRANDSLLDEIQSTRLLDSAGSVRYDWPLLAAGFVALLAGGQITISHGVELAGIWGMSSAVIGLFVVAIGTSMPELVTSIIAALRGDSDLAVGNVVGSNLFNGLMVLPISALVRPVAVPAGGLVDLLFSLLLAAALIPLFLFGRARMDWRVGSVFCLAYGLYAIYRLS